LRSEPGTVYMASMTGAEHFVEHAAEEEDVPAIAGLGRVKVVVLLRCAVFRGSRGAIRANPTVVHDAALEAVNEWLLDQPLELPTLEECKAMWP
jgi:hypothetical protein